MSAPDNPEMQRIAGEGALLAGGARAILLQVAHPAVGRGVAEHSDFADRPLERLRSTLTYVYTVTYGTPGEIRAVTDMVNSAHRKVSGLGYSAFDPALQLWVAATLYDTALLIYEALFGALPATDAERAYQQYAVLATALQVPAGSWPADRAAFRSYWDDMLGTLAVTDHARTVAHDLLHPKRAPLPLRLGMPLNRFLTAAWLPAPTRSAYDMPWTEGHQHRYNRLIKVASALYPRLPAAVREAPKTYVLRDMRKRLGR
jgi:uncharacterized protein (DUF2236 family)